MLTKAEMQESERILGEVITSRDELKHDTAKREERCYEIASPRRSVLDPVLHTHKEFSITPLYPPMSIPHYLRINRHLSFMIPFYFVIKVI